ncbi:MAG TPA: type II secretion system F family protein, partial [Gemmatales bacterium]|nr:type II secretion system F family protein [Gemmatales bacterium]
ELFTRDGASQAGLSRSMQASVEIWKDAALTADKESLLEQLLPKIPSIEKYFEQAEMNIRPSAFMALSLLLVVLGSGASFVMSVPFPLFIIPGLIMGFIPWYIVIQKRKKRLKKFTEQMPDAMELLARALRAGQSLVAGLQIIAQEMPPPISTEFGRVYEEQNLGVTVDEALRNMSQRVPILDLNFFVTSVIVQRQTGGDLAEILDKISYVIRERFRIWGQVQALTGEGRMSGTVLIALPFVMLLLVIHLNYDYAAILWKDETGRKWSLYALAMQVIGAFVIRKIVNIKV